MDIREEREIRIYDLFISICQRWRALILWTVIGAVLLGGYGWLKSAASAQSTVPPSQEQMEAAWLELLGPASKFQVDEIYQLILEYQDLEAEQRTVTDPQLRLENLNTLMNIQERFSAAKLRFSTDQITYLDTLLGASSAIPGDEASSTTNSDPAASGSRHLDVKMVVIGAGLGLILAILFIIIKYIAVTTIKTAEETEENLGLPLIARFDGGGKFYKNKKAGLDRWLRKKKQRNLQRPAYQDNLKMAAAKIQIMAEQADLKKICFLTDSNTDLSCVKDGVLSEDLKAAFDTDTVEICFADAAVEDSEGLQALAASDGAVLLLQVESSRFRDVQYEKALCEGCGAKLMGSIVLE